MNVGTNKKARAAFALTLGAAFTIGFWLLHSQASPLYDYAIWNPTIGNVMITLSIPAYLVGVLASGNVHDPSEVMIYVALFIQWAALGYLLALFLFRSKPAGLLVNESPIRARLNAAIRVLLGTRHDR
jgi:hypothetical protein